MMSCCNLCYKKYIEEDMKTIDLKTFRLLESTYSIEPIEESEICTCVCHVKGMMCLH